MFLGKGVLKICSKCTREHPSQSVISLKTHLKSRFSMGVLLQICCIFSEHLFLRTPLDGCICLLSAASASKRNNCINLSLKWYHVIQNNTRLSIFFFFRESKCLNMFKWLLEFASFHEEIMITLFSWNFIKSDFISCPRYHR